MLPRLGITSAPGSNGERPADLCNKAYIDAVAGAGGLPIVIPILDPAYVDDVLDAIDALVMSGGGDVDPARYGEVAAPEVGGIDERRDAWELALVRAALGRGVPVLGICRGAQLLNVAFGGTLVQDLSAMTDGLHRVVERHDELVHPVQIEPLSKLADVIGTGPIGANTLHHQAVAELGCGLRAVAWAQDGTIEAIETDDAASVLAVQWHPELLVHRPLHRRLFEWLVGEARRAVAIDDTADDDERGVA